MRKPHWSVTQMSSCLMSFEGTKLVRLVIQHGNIQFCYLDISCHCLHSSQFLLWNKLLCLSSSISSMVMSKMGIWESAYLENFIVFSRSHFYLGQVWVSGDCLMNYFITYHHKSNFNISLFTKGAHSVFYNNEHFNNFEDICLIT